MRETRLFWFHLEEKGNQWQGIKVGSMTHLLEHFGSLINRIAVATGRVTYETPANAYSLYLHTTIRTGGSRAIGVGFDPELYSSTAAASLNFENPINSIPLEDPHDATLRDARDALEQTQKHNNYAYFTKRFQDPKGRIGILYELSHLCGNAKQDVRISFATASEPFSKCPLNVSLGPSSRRQLESWIESEQKEQAPELIGRYVGFYSSRNQFWLKLEGSPVDVLCLYEGDNFRDLLGDVVLNDGDIIEVEGDYLEMPPKPPIIKNVKKVTKLRDAREENWEFQDFNVEEEEKEIFECPEIVESLDRSEQDIQNKRVMSYEDLVKRVAARERKTHRKKQHTLGK